MKQNSSFLDTDSLPWRDTPYRGVSWKKLHYGPDGSTVLLRFEAGASYGAHRHPEGEEYLVLEGTLRDGADIWGAGTFVRHPPGSVHKPSSPAGCLIFVRLGAPIEDLEQTPGSEEP